MDIKIKRALVQDWMRQNKRRVGWYSILKPDLTADICSDPLFKPLVLAESIFNKDRAFKKFWATHLADNVDSRLITYTQNDAEAAFNIYLAKHHLIHEHYWNGGGYGKLLENKPYFELCTVNSKINSFQLYQFALIYENIRCVAVQGFLDSNLNIFKALSKENHSQMMPYKDSKHHAFAGLVNTLHAQRDVVAIDKLFKHVLTPDSILGQSFCIWLCTITGRTSVSNVVDDIISWSTDDNMALHLIAKMTHMDTKDLEAYQILNPSFSVFYKMVSELDGCNTSITNAPLPVF